jgi:hypothetical protein
VELFEYYFGRRYSCRELNFNLEFFLQLVIRIEATVGLAAPSVNQRIFFDSDQLESELLGYYFGRGPALNYFLN